jgi:hypothetical protein
MQTAIMPGVKTNYSGNDVETAIGRILFNGWAVYRASK